MKTLIQASVVIACLCVTVQAREVTLTISSGEGYPTILSDQLAIGTNEVAEVTSVFGSITSYMGLRVIKNGITNSVVPLAGASTANRVRVAGPATLHLHYYGGPDWGCCFCSVKIEPESFPPGQTIILPEGTVGVVHVESSTNLVTWQDEWVHTFSNTNQNRFFRLRAERSLP